MNGIVQDVFKKQNYSQAEKVSRRRRSKQGGSLKPENPVPVNQAGGSPTRLCGPNGVVERGS